MAEKRAFTAQFFKQKEAEKKEMEKVKKFKKDLQKIEQDIADAYREEHRHIVQDIGRKYQEAQHEYAKSLPKPTLPSVKLKKFKLKVPEMVILSDTPIPKSHSRLSFKPKNVKGVMAPPDNLLPVSNASDMEIKANPLAYVTLKHEKHIYTKRNLVDLLHKRYNVQASVSEPKLVLLNRLSAVSGE